MLDHQKQTSQDFELHFLQYFCKQGSLFQIKSSCTSTADPCRVLWVLKTGGLMNQLKKLRSSNLSRAPRALRNLAWRMVYIMEVDSSSSCVVETLEQKDTITPGIWHMNPPQEQVTDCSNHYNLLLHFLGIFLPTFLEEEESRTVGESLLT